MSLPTNKLYFTNNRTGSWTRQDPSSFELPSKRSKEIGIFTSLCSQSFIAKSESRRLVFPTLDQHLLRLSKNAVDHPKIINLEKNELNSIKTQVDEISKIPFSASIARLRILITAKSFELYLDSYQNPWLNLEGIKVCSLEAQRQFPRCKHIPASVSKKSREYATKHGYHEAILLNEKNELLEGAWSNIFWFDKKGKLHSPTDGGILAGVTRGILRNIDSITLSSLQLANLEKTVSEMFLTQSTSGITSIRYFNDLDLGTDFTLSEKLKEKYQEELSRLSEQA